MKRNILITGIIGIIGAILMFIGDMLLYYTPNSFDYETEFLTVLGQSSVNRLFWGGFLGPIAAFLYCIGFYQLYLVIKPKFWKFFVFLILSLSIIVGGAFHSHFTYMGLASAEKQNELLNLIKNSITTYYLLTAGLGFIGFLALSVLIAFRKTLFPRWIILCTPLILFLGFTPAKSLPAPFAVIIAGGWMNIIHIVFFTVSTLYLIKKLPENE